MNKITIELDWDELGSEQKKLLFVCVKLPFSFLKNIFNTLTKDQQQVALMYQSWTSQQVFDMWSTLDTDDQILCIQKHMLQYEHVVLLWDSMTEAQREWVCLIQHLPLDFIEKVWDMLSDRAKQHILLKQDLPISFILDNWTTLTGSQKGIIVANVIDPDWTTLKIDKELLLSIDRLVELAKPFNYKLPIELLPQFITSDYDLVREFAHQLLQQNLEKSFQVNSKKVEVT